MVAVLATYAIKSRQNEIVTWTSAGQSIYRLLLPCFLLTLLIGGVNWAIQEYLLPSSNQKQEAIRAIIRNRGELPKPPGRMWTASGKRIYSFMPEQSSDSERRSTSARDVAVFEFSDDLAVLTAAFRGSEAAWTGKELTIRGNVERNDIAGGRVQTAFAPEYRLIEQQDPFAENQLNPPQMNTRALINRAQAVESDSDRRSLEVIIEHRYAMLFVPLIMALFTAPFAVSFSKRGKASGVAGAVTVWLLFAGAVNVCDQLGKNGALPPRIAVWAPLFVFASLGSYLIAKART